MDHPEVQDPAAPSAPAPPGTAPSPAPRLALEEPADGVEVLEPDGNDTGKDLAPYADTWREATGSRSGPDRSAKIRALFRLGRTQDRVRQEIPHMADRKPIESWLTDMDGVLIHEGVPIPGADAFIKRLRESGKPFLVLTNNSIYTPRDLHARLRRMGLEVPIESIWTSALATAKFLDDQRPNGSAYVIGEAGLTTALHDIGYVLTDHEPDYVVLGETRTYSFEAMTKAVRLIDGFDARQAYGPRRAGRAELRLVTCGGSFDRASGHYTANVIVSAYLTGTTTGATAGTPTGRVTGAPAGTATATTR
ncbi:hypothetical protein SGRIM128S_06758 [Streptomyces griseomycini]